MMNLLNGKRTANNKQLGADNVDKLKILSGNACFLVQNTSDELTKEDFQEYLINEGFEKFNKYGWPNRSYFFINVNSLRFSPGVSKPAKLAATIIGENPRNMFTIEEFKTIWNILKRHIGSLNPTNEITKGTSAFLICDESLNEYKNEFIDYLNRENFKALDGDSYGGRGYVAVNVKSMIYSKGDMANVLVSTFVGDNSTCALTIEEFKTIWNIIKQHKEDCSIETLLGQCEESDDNYKVIECCDKIFEMNPDNAQALHYKVLALFDLKEYEKALELVDHALSIYPDDYRFCNIKAFILTDLYKIYEAIECYNNSFYLGGFDAEDSESTKQYRAICYLRKAREDFYIKKDLDEALISLNIYLNQFPDDDEATRFKDEMSHGKITPRFTRYHEKLMYFECKAYELYKLGFLRESFEAYREVFSASQDFKNNVDKTGYKWFDSVTGHGTSELDNFRWYDEVLYPCLGFKGYHREIFRKLFEINEQNVSACVDKAKLFSKIYRENLAIRYSRKLVRECPESSEANEFYNRITGEFEKRKRLTECARFKDYKSIDEYIEDVVFCLMHSCRYSEEVARNLVSDEIDEIKKSYDAECPADDFAFDYYPLCG